MSVLETARSDQHRAVVTGVAGFIGSHLAEALLEAGYRVVGIDAFTPYYAPAIKRANIAQQQVNVEALPPAPPAEPGAEG